MSNMHTLTHDNTFVIIQEIRAFHKIVVATACSHRQSWIYPKTALPLPTFVDPGKTVP